MWIGVRGVEREEIREIERSEVEGRGEGSDTRIDKMKMMNTIENCMLLSFNDVLKHYRVH
jgi:hypothetical protein